MLCPRLPCPTLHRSRTCITLLRILKLTRARNSNPLAGVKKGMLLAPLLALASALPQAVPQPVWVIDTVKVIPGQRQAVVDYYRSGWLQARKEAVRTQLILDYKAIILDEDPKEGTRILLMTKFASRAEVDAAEPTWQKILKRVMPNGPVLPSGLKSADIRTVIRSDKAVEMFQPGD